MNETKEPQSEALIRILHPSDFTRASLIAFAHALKIALQSKAELEIVHVAPHKIGSDKDVHWSDFPGVRATLARWQILPVDAAVDEIAKLGLRVKKILNSESDPLAAMTHYCETHPPDLLVLATHQREGFKRWLHKPVAEPLARRSRALTLFVPTHGQGFISPANGAATLRRILIPVDHTPNAQAAVEEAFFLAQGLACRDAHFKLLHVGTEKGMPTLFLPHHPGYQWSERMVNGAAVEAILREDALWSPDLIAFATQGHRDFLDALRGSTTERVLRGAHCPVLAVPARA
ncbi:MAG: Universal stress protein [Deltaproteobacteria bacterium]|jgi:nucleotide-binding universal stress UspA family protein|nr:Universal stress protein [Deltaproteobacteria bacterium]